MPGSTTIAARFASRLTWSAVFALVLVGVVSGCEGLFGGRPNVVLITLDTTRADHLGCYGYERETSPNVDRLAEASIVYTKMISTSSWTLPAHATLFTGKFTSSHGARYHPEGPLLLSDAIGGPWSIYRARGLGEEERTLAQVLKEAGYATGAVVGGPWMKRIFGLDRGFEFYDDGQVSTLQGALAEQVTDSALGWLEGSDDREFFLFVNYYDPHVPYLPPPEFQRAFLPDSRPIVGRRPSLEDFRDLYDAEILYMDRELGRLLDGLRERDLYDSSWIIVTADHGELFGENGRLGHGHTLFEGEIRIPLIVKPPAGRWKPGRSDELIQLTDITPMILDALGLEIPPGVQGSIPPALQHPIIAELYTLPEVSPDGEWRALREGDLKFLWNSQGDHRLHDLAADPGESENLVDVQPSVARAMEERLEQYLSALPSPGTPGPARHVDEATREALEKLGYLE
jgi:arylsulfatase A-like enzyme